MTRSLWKGPFSENTNNLVTNSKKISQKPTQQFRKNKIWSRRSVILPALLNKELLIYNGKLFILS